MLLISKADRVLARDRLFAWLHNFRRLVTRWEYQEANFLGMLQLGCLLILARHL
jgi:transposase